MSHKENLKNASKIIFKNWEYMLDKALGSGALTMEMKDANNYLLVKAVIHAWYKKNPFQPLDKKTQMEYTNLSYFI